MDRRTFNLVALLAGMFRVTSAAKASSSGEHDHATGFFMQKYPDLVGGDEVTIGMVVYPGMFLLDLVGPLAVFESLLNRKIHLLWKDTQPVGGTSGTSTVLIPVTPTTSFADCPKTLDLLFVPGGVNGTLQMMEDPVVLQFLADQAPRSKYVASVCTGSLILGAAGLLKGYRATSHWMTIDALRELGATPVKERVVIDRNRITGGGVTAGMDFGLALVALLRNRTYAEAVQLYLEYDPKPPFNAGSPYTAPKRVKEFLDDMLGQVSSTSIDAAKRARGKWKD
jgi:cyclohexyl-isocyanide hydratase